MSPSGLALSPSPRFSAGTTNLTSRILFDRNARRVVILSERAPRRAKRRTCFGGSPLRMRAAVG